MTPGRRARRRRRAQRGPQRPRPDRRRARRRQVDRWWNTTPARILLTVASLALPAILTLVVGYWTDPGSDIVAGLGGLAVVLVLNWFWWRSNVFLLLLLVVPMLAVFNTGPRFALRQHGTRVNTTVLDVQSHTVHHRRSSSIEADYRVLGPDQQPLVVHSVHEPRYAPGDPITVVVDPKRVNDPAVLDELDPLWELVVGIAVGALVLWMVYAGVDVDEPWRRRRSAR